MATWQGKWQGQGLKIGIVLARFNHFITDRLLEGAIEALTRAGVREQDIDVLHVPGRTVELEPYRRATAERADGSRQIIHSLDGIEPTDVGDCQRRRRRGTPTGRSREPG